MQAHADLDLVVADLEGRNASIGKRSRPHRDAERAEVVARPLDEGGGGFEGGKMLARVSGDLHLIDRAGDAATVLDVHDRRVVGDEHGAARDPLGREDFGRDVEIEHVARIIAVDEHDALAGLDRARSDRDLIG